MDVLDWYYIVPDRIPITGRETDGSQNMRLTRKSSSDWDNAWAVFFLGDFSWEGGVLGWWEITLLQANGL